MASRGRAPAPDASSGPPGSAGEATLDRRDARERRLAPRRGATRLAVLWIAIAVLSVGCAAEAAPMWRYPPSPDPGAVPGPSASGVPAAPGSSAVASPIAVHPSAQPSATPTTVPAALQRVDVPVLYYHRVIAPPRGFARWPRSRRERFLRYDTLPVAFEAQLDWLAANGYTTILPRDLAAFWDSGVALPARPVIITFDDGTHDWARTVLPMLRERGMIAQFYVTLQAIPSGGMTWRELRVLAAAGNGIGAHGLHHRQLAGFGGKRRAVPEAVMRREVARPRALIEARLGIVPDSYSYVGGGFDATLRRLVREAGYTTGRSIIHGHGQEPAHRYTMRVLRIGVHLDVTDVIHGRLRPGLPGFARLLSPRP